MLKTFTAFMKEVRKLNEDAKWWEKQAMTYEPGSRTCNELMDEVIWRKKKVEELCEDHPIFATMYNLNKKRGRAV